MGLLHFFSYFAILAAFAFVTLSIASGLLYVSELIEEHSRDAKSIGQRGIYAIIFLHVLLYLSDSLPLPHILFSIICHIVYLQNFSARWPFISLTSLSFIASCILVVADHFLWFFYFARVSQEARHTAHRPASGRGEDPPTFAEIATFFGVCVWLAPLFLFLSLSAGDHALPTSSGLPATPTSATTPAINVPPNPNLHTSTPSSLFKSLFSVLPVTRKQTDKSEGLIAPRTPTFPAIHSTPSSPAARSFSNPNHRNSLPPPPMSPLTPGGGAGPGLSTHLLSSSNPIGSGPDFRLGAPPSRRVTGRAANGGGDNPTGTVRRATVDSVGIGRRSLSRGKEAPGYD